MPEIPLPARLANVDRKILSVTWPLIVISVLMLSLSVFSLTIMSSTRAYVNGESMWSKAERRAIAELRKFGNTGASTDYQNFRTEIAVPLNDRVARLELQKINPDYPVASSGLIAGRNFPDDVPGMMRLFRIFQNYSLFAEAISIWTRGDMYILQLDEVGRQMHTAVESGGDVRNRVSQLLDEAELIHLRVAPLEDEFSAALGHASRVVSSALLIFLTLCSTILVAIGAAISRITIRRSERMADTLRATQEQAYVEQVRARVTLGSIVDAVISTDRERRVIYMNGAAEQLTGWLAAEADCQSLGTIMHIHPEPNTTSVMAEIERVMGGEQLSGAATGVLLQRRDGSATPVHERASPIRDQYGDVTGIVLVLRDITQERAFATQLHHQATHDALTGLTNRREFEHQLLLAIEDQKRTRTDYALLYLDLDQFKVVNDTCGHAAGDELIRQVSWVVRQGLRAGDVLARLGGDEFGALLTGCPHEVALKIAEAVRSAISELRFIWGGKIFVVNASIGVLSLADCLPTVSEVMSAVDQACYLAKDNGRNRVQSYRPDDQEVRARHGEMQWVERLNAALELDRFALFAQEIRPVASQAENRGEHQPPRYEILVRLVDTDGALIAPTAFIPAAERYGLMPRIDRWVIAHACKELADMRSSNARTPACMINLSGASVTDADLADFVCALLARYGLPWGSIGFELTETAAITNLANAAQLMNRLKKLGCPIALDDFGSGMSSFEYLRNLPVDFLKIDGAFVKNMTADAVNYAVVEAIQNIGRVMGIQTVAESVEDEDVLAALTLIGVDFAQGFFLGRPVPLREIILRQPAEEGDIKRNSTPIKRRRAGR
jgi:diguanylate cyclase (GGDEF)-like protein/PAS domain S-box-containing protein